MAFEYSQNLSAVFGAAGYEDVTYGEVITARRDDGKVWEVIVDRGGQLRATITHRPNKPQEKFVAVLGRKASVLSEKRTVVTVFFLLEDNNELPEVLKAIEGAVGLAR